MAVAGAGAATRARDVLVAVAEVMAGALALPLVFLAVKSLMS